MFSAATVDFRCNQLHCLFAEKQWPLLEPFGGNCERLQDSSDPAFIRVAIRSHGINEVSCRVSRIKI